jgi:hypothetical protein
MKAESRVKGSVPLWAPAACLSSPLARYSGRNKCGEIRLVAALFEDALRCIVRNADAHHGQRWRDFVAAQEWFKDDRRDWPFAFANVCEFLALDAAEVRGYVDRIVSRHSPGSDADQS